MSNGIDYTNVENSPKFSWNHKLFKLSYISKNTRISYTSLGKIWFYWSRNGILLPKLFWPTVRKYCLSDQEKLLKFEAEGGEFTKV